MQEKNTFKLGDVVYYINNTSVYSNTYISEMKYISINRKRKILKLKERINGNR